MLTETDMQDKSARLVDREVRAYLSSLVATLASSEGVRDTETLSLVEQAMDLGVPIDDWTETAQQYGWTQSPEGWWHRAPAEDDGAEHEATHFMFLGSGPFVRAETAEDAARMDGAEDPVQREVCEHWAVSSWLADKLEQHGEKVDNDFAGLCVWARTTTGQSISMDAVIRAIAKRLHSGEEVA